MYQVCHAFEYRRYQNTHKGDICRLFVIFDVQLCYKTLLWSVTLRTIAVATRGLLRAGTHNRPEGYKESESKGSDV